MNIKIAYLALVFCSVNSIAQDKIFPGADENTPSRSQYSSWINHTNEGTDEKQTLTNLQFFQWMHDEYGMILDIYAMDAGVIDGKGFYGNSQSERFRNKFPQHFTNICNAGKKMHTRLGIWGGPDGFGNTPEEAAARKEEMISLCRDYDWALFKFDAVCGPLRPEKEDEFIDMMTQCRQYSPDLILLNHRLGLNKARPYATTFLWQGQETYIDVHTSNTTTAPHHRAGALARGLTPGLQRLTEDCGVCISSCLDYWEDDLILQAFNRSLILAPEIYGNPWLLNDDEFPLLARIYNLHRKYADILTQGMTLPATYGPYAVSRGNDNTRFLTLRNLNWNSITYTINLNEEIGLKAGQRIKVKLYHPTERIVGYYQYGDKIEVTVPSYRSLLLKATSTEEEETELAGIDYQIIKDIPGENIQIKLLGLPGTDAEISLPSNGKYSQALIDGKPCTQILKDGKTKIHFPGKKLQDNYHRKIGDLKPVSIPEDAATLYESTVFAADNNALEVRSLQRSGETRFNAVKAARDAFFNQKTFVSRGLWDKYLFDGDMQTGFWPSNRFGTESKIKGGCFRLDLGQTEQVSKIVLKLSADRDLEPLQTEESATAEISTDLINWRKIFFLTGKNMEIVINDSVRYLRMPQQPNAIAEVEVYHNGTKIDPANFRASNLFAPESAMPCQAAWKHEFSLSEVADNSYLCVAINGKHGIEGAYAALKIDGKYVGAPDRALSYPSNTWEYINKRTDSNYTYYFPIDKTMAGKKIEVFVLAYQAENIQLQPEVWLSAYPIPFKQKVLTLIPQK